MSLIPFFHDLDSFEYRRPCVFDTKWDSFGTGISPRELKALLRLPQRHSKFAVGEGADAKPVIIGKDGFQACIDVQHFKPNEITVKTIDNNVVIEGKHEERQDEHGHISRNFVRKYILPKGFDSKKVISTLSSDGFLTIKAPPPTQGAKERVIHIQHTGPAHLHVKDNQPHENKTVEK